MTFSWETLPKALESKLLPGSVGKMHLTGLARAAFGSSSHAALGVEMLLAAWEADPLDGMLAGQLAQLLPADDTGLRPMFSALAGMWRPDDYLTRLQQQGRGDRFFSVLEDKLGREGDSLFHVQRAVEFGLAEREPSWVKPLLETPFPEAVSPAVEYVRAMVALVGGDAEQARDGLRSLAATLPLPGVISRLGECECRLGNSEQAMLLWRQALAARPWDVSLLLRAHDVASGRDRTVSLLDGRVNVFLYTFNKCAELDQALSALAEAGLEGADLVVLDNGSTDETAAVLSRWQAEMGSRLEVVSLPVNVGAPAARNWLMRRSETTSNPWTLFLDDDAVVPGDWLGRLGAAVEAYPEAGVWGCKVVDGELPHVIQNADLHPRPDYGAEGEFPCGEMSDLHHQTVDAGWFDSLRPCTSVTGCCHLFRTETLLQSGDFDLMYSPSQFDDLDHDLRLALEGKSAVYQGHLSVRHMKRSGKLTRKGGAAFISGRSNHDKLKARFEGESWERIRNAALDVFREDIRRKAAVLGVG